VWGRIGQTLETFEPFIFEERIVRADGSEGVLLSQGRVVVSAGGAPEAVVGICHDITERTHAERALGASEQRMRAIIDNTPSLVTVKNLEGSYVMNNAEAARVAGIESGDLTGMHCVDLFPEHIATAQRANDRRAASEGEPIYDEATIVLDGEERSYRTVTFMLPDEHGVPAETCTIATDVTDQKERDSDRRVRLEWTERIDSALHDGRMLAFAQPIVDLRTGDHAADELLARMRVPGDSTEIQPPETFTPAAERYGLIQPLDVWMVSQALRMATSSPVHVNVSAVTMCDAGAREKIARLLAAHAERSQQIVFEITESANPEDLDAAREFAEAVTSAGARLALDDFGIGFGSFTYLRALPISYLKIDQSFVRKLDRRDDRRVAGAVIGIAREFGLQTIAEGVEDKATFEDLRSMGADLAQGYVLGRPAPLRNP
jgi:PAS domain S-box-containing protein